MLNEKNGFILISIFCLVVLVFLSVSNPIAQDAEYHHFSDSITLLNIPNALNVLSNIPFFVVGIAGLLQLAAGRQSPLVIVESNKLAYALFFIAVCLIALGSSYYHLWPSNASLVWDRLPMTIAFMALYSIIISERVSEQAGRYSLAPLLCLGIASVLYWAVTESQDNGDLRYYAIVQFFPLMTIPVMLLFFKSRFNLASAYWWLLAAYVVAKLLESYDSVIHEALVVVSGHSLKHVLSAFGLYILLLSYKNRSIT